MKKRKITKKKKFASKFAPTKKFCKYYIHYFRSRVILDDLRMILNSFRITILNDLREIP